MTAPPPAAVIEADRTLAAEFVLGTLDPEERKIARARIGSDPQFAALVRQWERRLAPLHELAVPVTPPPQLWRQILADLDAASGVRLAGPPRSGGAAPEAGRLPPRPEPKGRPEGLRTPGMLGRVGRLLVSPFRGRPPAPRPERRERRPRPETAAPASRPAPAARSPQEPTLGRAIKAATDAGLLPPPVRSLPPPEPAKRIEAPRPVAPPVVETAPAPPLPPPRPRPPPEPLTPPPAFMFLEPDPPPDAVPAPAVGSAAAPVPAAASAEDMPSPQFPTEGSGAAESAPEAAPKPPETGTDRAPADGVAAPALPADQPAAVDETAEARGRPNPQPDTHVDAESSAGAAAEAQPHPPPDANPPEASPEAIAGASPAAAIQPEAEAEVPSTAAEPTAITDQPTASDSDEEPPAHDDAPADAQPLPSWAEAVASGTVSALPEPEAGRPDTTAFLPGDTNPAEGEDTARDPVLATDTSTLAADEAAAVRRQLARWRLATGLLAALCLGLGSVMAYRTWFRPDDGHWVAVLRAEDAGHAVALRIDPASGTFHVRAFAPEPAAGETYRLWLVTKGRGALLLGTFATGLSDRAPALARMGIGALRTSEAVITREPLVRAPTAGASPGENVVYRGRLAPD